MGGFMGIGTSGEEKALQEQNRLRQAEADQARRDAEIALAERKASKGQETANIQLGTDADSELDDEVTTTSSLAKPKTSTISKTLGLGSAKTGVQT